MCVHNTFYDSMCETSQVLLAGVPGGFSRGSLVSAHIKYFLVIDLGYTLEPPNPLRKLNAALYKSCRKAGFSAAFLRFFFKAVEKARFYFRPAF